MANKWQFKMWYYTKSEAEKIAGSFKKRGFKTRITRSKNRNLPEGSGHIYNVWYR